MHEPPFAPDRGFAIGARAEPRPGERFPAQTALLVALALFVAAGCSSQKPPAPPAVQSTYVAGADPVEDANALWARIRTNAEKAGQGASGDPDTGWIERAIQADGRALFDLLGQSVFDPHAVPRDAIRARLMIVIKPPTPQDRQEAVQTLDRAFADFFKRARAVAPS